MTDIILGVVILVIVALAGGYVYKARKKGVKCIGCPSGSNCHSSSKSKSKSDSSDCGCGCGGNDSGCHCG